MDNKIKALRKEKNISQAQLAEATGVTVAAISRYENGKRKVTVDTAKKIAEALNTELANVF